MGSGPPIPLDIYLEHQREWQTRYREAVFSSAVFGIGIGAVFMALIWWLW